MADHETPEELQKKLNHLDEEITEVKDHMPESEGGSPRRHFIDDGARDRDEPVDNTIVPPG